MYAVHEETYRNQSSQRSKPQDLDLQGAYPYLTETLLHFFSNATTEDSESLPLYETIVCGSDDNRYSPLDDDPDSLNIWYNGGSQLFRQQNELAMGLYDEIILNEEIDSLEEKIAHIEEQKHTLKSSTDLFLSSDSVDSKTTSPESGLSLNFLQDILNGSLAQLTEDHFVLSSGSSQGSSVEDEDINVEFPTSNSSCCSPITSPVTSPSSTTSCTENKSSPLVASLPKKIHNTRNTSSNKIPNTNDTSSKNRKRKKLHGSTKALTIDIDIEFNLLDLSNNSISNNNKNNNYTPKKRKTKLQNSQKRFLQEVFKEEKVLKIKAPSGPQDEDVDIGNISDCTNY